MIGRRKPLEETPQTALRRVLTSGLIGSMSLFMLGCPATTARKPQFSTPINAPEAENRELDTGYISIHAAVARAVPFGEERLAFGQLSDAARVFALLQGSSQASRIKSTYSALSIGASVTSPVLDSLAVTESSQLESKGDDSGTESTTVEDGKTKSLSEAKTSETSDLILASEQKATYTKPTPAASPAGALSLPATSTPVTATPYELFYATAETLLAARSLENLYNVADGPEGWRLFSIPIVATFEPGRVTRRNYTGESHIEFGLLKEGQSPAAARIRLLAVAPAGLSHFSSSSISELARLQASVGASVPLSAAALQLQVGAVRDALDAFTSMARRPDVQVSIADDRTLVIRYLGRETFEGGVALSPMSFNMEILALVEIGKWMDELDPPDDKKPPSPRRLGALSVASTREAHARPTAGDLEMKITSRFKPAFQAKANDKSRTNGGVSTVVASGLPAFRTGESCEHVTAYIPSKPTRIETALRLPDGRVLLNGDFQERACLCLTPIEDAAVPTGQVAAGGSPTSRSTEPIFGCTYTDRNVPSLLFSLAKKDWRPKEQGEFVAGVSLHAVKDSTACSKAWSGDGLIRMAFLSVKPAITPAKVTESPGSATISSVFGSLDNLGATLFVEYAGDATDPLVLVDGQAAPRTRLELVKQKIDKVEKVAGGRVWLRISGSHDPKLMEKTYLLSVGAGTSTKETRVVVARR